MSDTATVEAGAGEKTARKRQGVYIQTPDALRAALEQDANAQNITVASLVAKRLADAYGVQLPVRAPRQKYANADERKAALTAKRKDRAALVKMLLEKYAAEQASEQQAAAA